MSDNTKFDLKCKIQLCEKRGGFIIQISKFYKEEDSKGNTGEFRGFFLKYDEMNISPEAFAAINKHANTDLENFFE